MDWCVWKTKKEGETGLSCFFLDKHSLFWFQQLDSRVKKKNKRKKHQQTYIGNLFNNP